MSEDKTGIVAMAHLAAWLLVVAERHGVHFDVGDRKLIVASIGMAIKQAPRRPTVKT